jgi:2-methylisocitrate lyase-like PEP mutase family enzyme
MSLKTKIQNGFVVAPGVSDALGALIATEAGFDAVYLSGASIAYTRFGRPDVGLVTATEVEACLAAICDRVETPVIVDADTGFGNVLNVQRTVRAFERAGAAAIQIEDQSFPKRCGHLADKKVVPAQEMAGKIRAAVDARHSADTLIIARTDAIAVEGFDAAVDRMARYAEAGADVLFVEAPQDVEQQRALPAKLGHLGPLLANMVEGGRTPMADAKTLAAMGYRVAIFPGGLVRAAAHMTRAYMASLKANGTNDPFRDRMLDFKELNGLVGTPEILALGKKYE